MEKERKQELRKKVLAMRRSLSSEEIERRSRVVLDHLYSSGLLEGGQTYALYAAADGEVLTRPLFERLIQQGKKVALPRVRGAGPEIDFYSVIDWGRLSRSRLGIPEPPASGSPVEPGQFDFVLAPGVAFDACGGRLGYGMGCYDRILDRVKKVAVRAGIGYDFQLVDRIPMEAHDVMLTAVILERGVLLPGERGSN